MSANTAVAENSANFSVEKPLKTDSFTIADGHYVGHDGFVVPKDFEEFYERFPQHVRNWVGRHVERSTPRQDVEDWTQDLLAHLCCLPPTSKYREAGKRDIVATFDPYKHYGASSARFFNYINLCLGNRFKTIRSTRAKDAIWRTGNFSFTGLSDAIDTGQVDDEFCHSHSEHLREGRERQQKQQDARLVLAEFSDFVRCEDSSLMRAMEAIAATATPGPAAELLGTTIGELCRMRSRLRQLGRCFQSGARVPRRRRPYRRRLTKRIIFRVR
jgi:hypothetical protein